MQDLRLVAEVKTIRAISLSGLSILLAGLAMPALYAQSTRNADRVFIDASAPSASPEPSSYRGGSSTSPSGQTLGLNSMYLTLNGKPWLPVMGEFHFSRVPEAEWEEEILKMKAAGVSIVADLCFLDSPRRGRGPVRLVGTSRSARFVELCAKHGLMMLWCASAPGITGR